MAHFLKITCSARSVLDFSLHDGPVIIDANTSLLRQIIMNLVRNASEAMDDTGGTITISDGVHTLSKSNAGDTGDFLDLDLPRRSFAFLKISDTGCGIDEETLSHVFLPYYTTKNTGCGLGLTTIQRIVHSMDGVIDLKSCKGLGTTVTVFLPSADSTV